MRGRALGAARLSGVTGSAAGERPHAKYNYPWRSATADRRWCAAVSVEDVPGNVPSSSQAALTKCGARTRARPARASTTLYGVTRVCWQLPDLFSAVIDDLHQEHDAGTARTTTCLNGRCCCYQKILVCRNCYYKHARSVSQSSSSQTARFGTRASRAGFPPSDCRQYSFPLPTIDAQRLSLLSLSSDLFVKMAIHAPNMLPFSRGDLTIGKVAAAGDLARRISPFR